MSEGKYQAGQVSESDAADAEAKKSEGNKAYGAGNYQAAIEFYSDAIALNPYNKVYYSNRCASYTCLEDMPAAIADGQKCVALAPDWHKGWFRLANAQKVDRQFVECMATINKGLAKHPDQSDLTQLKKTIKDDYDRDKAARYAAKPRDEQLKEDGNDKFKLADYAGAIECYTAGIAACRDPQSKLMLDMHNNRAACYQQLGDWHLVIQDSSEALAIDENNLKALKRRALGWDNMEKYSLGFADCKRYCELDGGRDKFMLAKRGQLQKLKIQSQAARK